MRFDEALPPISAGPRLELTLGRLGGVCDILVVTKPVNVRWLTGFTGSNGIAAVTPDGLILVTDERYTTQAQQELALTGAIAEVRIGRDLFGLIADAVADKRVGVEDHHITWQAQRELAELVGGGTVVAAGPVVDNLRRTKDLAELARLERAAAIADAALERVMNDTAGMAPSDQTSGISERGLARKLEQAMFDLGADDVSFPTIVAAGPNSALPHARPSHRPLQPGDLLVIDMGARVDGYGSDMTRTFALGGFSAESERMYRAVEAAQQAGVAAVADGVSTRHVHQVTSGLLDDHGLGQYFIHGTGHGIGLEIHETPFLSKSADDTLRTGYVVTVEPGVYLPDVGGVRIEDSVLVTEDGCRPLTKHPKDPVLPI